MISQAREPSQPAFPRTALVDALVRESARATLARELNFPFALIAVGGYGRGELFPFSDVDLILLLEKEPDPAILKEPLGNFVRLLWDASLKVSHSVRSVDECCRYQAHHSHLHISLLDVRWVYGSAAVFDALAIRLPAFYARYSPPLLEDLAKLTTHRHARFDDTVYHLEPNIKEGPGGIRDVHFLHWAHQLDPAKSLFLHAMHESESAQQFLYLLRYFLHEKAGRDINLLTFELQDEAAAELPGEPLPPESWMRIFYGHARTCSVAAEQVLDSIRRSRTGLLRQLVDRKNRHATADFVISRQQVFLRRPAEMLSNLRSLLVLFLFVGKTGYPCSWETLRRIRERLPALSPADAAPVFTWAEWHDLLSEPHASLAVRNLRDCGVLSLVLPEWHAIESLVVRDFYHRYTVDEHTLVALETVDSLLGGSGEHAHSRFRELAGEEDHMAVLRMALLLHDLGKGLTPGEHIRGSLEAANEILSRIQMPKPEAGTVKFLIANHLLLSAIMTGRDLEDPATARLISSQTGTQENLRKLTLLTFADVSAVTPSAMSPWRAEQLWRVYVIGSGQLTRELDSSRIGAPDPSLEQSTLRPELADFLRGFPTRYLRVHSMEQIEEHFQMDEIRRAAGVAIEIGKVPGAYAATVLAADHAGLFCDLCGALASFGLNIVKAEAASNASHCALDEFHFTDPSRTLELNPEEIERLRWTVRSVVNGTLMVKDLLRRRANHRLSPVQQIAPSVRFDNHASDTATLLHFTGEDRPGLLYDLSSALTALGCNIELVLVDTEGHRAIDVFYITCEGGKLDALTQAKIVRNLESPSRIGQ